MSLKKDRPTLRYTSSGLLENNPTAEARSAATNPQALSTLSVNVQKDQNDYPKANVQALGSVTLTHGQYKGQSFKWLLENDVGYTVFVVGSYLRDKKDGKNLTTFHMKNQVRKVQEYLNVKLNVIIRN